MAAVLARQTKCLLLWCRTKHLAAHQHYCTVCHAGPDCTALRCTHSQAAARPVATEGMCRISPPLTLFSATTDPTTPPVHLFLPPSPTNHLNNAPNKPCGTTHTLQLDCTLKICCAVYIHAQQGTSSWVHLQEQHPMHDGKQTCHCSSAAATLHQQGSTPTRS